MYGLAIVISMIVAVLVKGIVVLLSSTSRAPVVVSAPKPKPVVAAGIPAEHVAAIAATVYSMMGSHRIVHIGDSPLGATWSAEGKIMHQTSHNLNRPHRNHNTPR
ncbi:Conserved protein of unknown function [Magnetospira sp. QH-2]|nr:Conserved protein of unknown function [Magnetospira sp. QH-2]